MIFLQFFTQKRVIARKNLPARAPLDITLLAYLLLERFDASIWVWGVLGLFVLSLWIDFIVRLIRDHEVDVINK